MKENDIINRLLEIQKNFPELTFQNNGYEYIPDILSRHPEEVAEISSLLKQLDPDFTRFDNFRVMHDGGIAARYHGYYDPSFIGVNYLRLKPE